MITVGSILHGAYGDYYNQLVSLKHLKRQNPAQRLILFFASEHRRKELGVFDLSFADEIHPVKALTDIPVDRFFQFQVRDEELREEVLAHLPHEILTKIDPRTNRKPWSILRKIDFSDPEAEIGLSEEGRERLPDCYRENELDEVDFESQFTVGFLWRYRGAGGAISPRFMPSEEFVRESMAALLSRLIEQYDARVLVCGMNVKVTDENRFRIDAKYSESDLGLDPTRCRYLKGLSWGLELEIVRRCSLCLLMPSGFSEALWMKRRRATVMVSPPPDYVMRLLWNRMPLFNVLKPRELFFESRLPHTPTRVMQYLTRANLLPDPLAQPLAACAKTH